MFAWTHTYIYIYMCVCVCVCARARACLRVCVKGTGKLIKKNIKKQWKNTENFQFNIIQWVLIKLQA